MYFLYCIDIKQVFRVIINFKFIKVIINLMEIWNTILILFNINKVPN